MDNQEAQTEDSQVETAETEAPEAETADIADGTEAPAETPAEEPAKKAAPVNKNKLKKEVREAVDGIEIGDGEVPLFREKVGWEEDEDDKEVILGYVVLHNAEDEAPVQRLMEIAEGKFNVYLQEWTEESKRGKWEAKKDGKTTRRVNSTYKGHNIFLTDDVIDAESGEVTNPRREGTHGYNAFEVVKKYLEENGREGGMPYEKYIELGGASNHLNWDVGHNYVETKPAKAEEEAEAA